MGKRPCKAQPCKLCYVSSERASGPLVVMNRFYQEPDLECFGERKSDPHRSVFQVDRDRILYTSAFRRLQGKTQVFLSGEYDFYRTRLTHSLEVAQIGRAICRFLSQTTPDFDRDFCVDEDLVEGICLAHDLGHPPFGHAGERVLHDLMLEWGGFEGNAQTIRLVTSTIYADGEGRRGMAPSRATLDGLLKYKRLFKDRDGAGNHYLYDSHTEVLDFVCGNSDRPRTGGSVECQIMDWADDTAYSINDIVDGVEAGFLTQPKIEAWAAENGVGDREELEDLFRCIRGGSVKAKFGRQIGDFIRGTRLEKVADADPSAGHRYAYRLQVEPEVRRRSELYKAMSRDLVFRSPILQQHEFKGRQILERIFEALRDCHMEGKTRLRLLPRSFEDRLMNAGDLRGRARILCDFVAGMTDGYAVRFYRRLYDAGYGSITELE